MKRPEKITLELYCDYTQQEMDAKRDRLSAAILEYDKVDDEKKEVVKTYKDTLKLLRGEMRSLSKSLTRKGEPRPLECVVQFHTPDVGLKTVVRPDTGEIVMTEPMTDDERQENLFDEIEGIERMFNMPDTRADNAPTGDSSGESAGE